MSRYALTKCFKCTKVITGQSCELGKRMFHFDCLTCNHCKGVLGGDDHGKIRDNRIFCKACFTKRFRPRCSACRQPIPEGDGLSSQGKTLHQTCFRCAGCQRPMGPGKQVMLKGEIYCQLKCQQERAAREKAAAAALAAAAQAAKNAPPPASEKAPPPPPAPPAEEAAPQQVETAPAPECTPADGAGVPPSTQSTNGCGPPPKAPRRTTPKRPPLKLPPPMPDAPRRPLQRIRRPRNRRDEEDRCRVIAIVNRVMLPV